jgi:hypothetical protein
MGAGSFAEISLKGECSSQGGAGDKGIGVCGALGEE